MEKGNGNTVLLTIIGVATLLVALVGATFAYFTANATSNSSQSLSITTAAPVALVTTDVGAAISLENAVPGAISSTDTQGVEGEGEDAHGTGQQGFTVENPSISTVKQTYDLSLVIDEDTFVTTCLAGKATRTLTTEGDNPVTYATAGQDVNCSDQNVINDFADQLELTIAQSTVTNPTTGDASPLKLGTVNTEAEVLSRNTTTHTVVYNLTNGSAVETAQKYVLVNDQLIAPGEKHKYDMTLHFKEIHMNQSANAATVDNTTNPVTINGKSFTGHLLMDDVKAVANS